ncbi:MAG TPA: fumarate reductase (CoM/CoB) subunit TfrA [Methanoregulaceae archaeon]|nr:fumarate reductase (CoM/CoB) subunit TfrA [Methanoregulaceae archaeon]
MRSDDIVSCHVLVIGSGGAGVRAAIEADAYGNTVLISKTIVGKGGCTPMAEGGYNAVISVEDSCDIHFEDTLRGGAYLNDHELVRILVKEAPQRMNDLIKWGAVFDVTSDSCVAQRPFGGQRFPRTCYAGDRTGHEMMVTLTEKLKDTSVAMYQEISVIALLRDNGGISGAIGLDRKGEMITFLADTTVLATGGGTKVYDISTNSSSGTGDGYAIGYNAGAELIDMEQVQFHPTGAVYPYDARGRLVTEAVRGEGGVLKNRLGERFMERYDPARMELSTRDVVSRSIATEILEGRGTDHQAVYLDVTHLPARQIEERLPIMLEQFLKFGVDIRKEPMEVAPTAHHIMGGFRIASDCSTTLERLFACGEVAGGVHGANRLGGNALADTQVFGKRAGESAGKSKIREKRPDEVQVDTQSKRLDRFLQGNTNPADVIRDLKMAMWEGAGIFRTREGLEKTLQIIQDLKKVPLRAQSMDNLADCCTAENMLTTASLIVQSALLRPESRGAHVRKDIVQDWQPETSPFGHTYISLTCRGIEKVSP